MLLNCNIKTIVKYAERRIMCITPNEAKRLGVKEYHSSSGNSVGVQPTSGLRERGCIRTYPQSLRFIGGYAHSTLRVLSSLIIFFNLLK